MRQEAVLIRGVRRRGAESVIPSQPAACCQRRHRVLLAWEHSSGVESHRSDVPERRSALRRSRKALLSRPPRGDFCASRMRVARLLQYEQV